MTLEKCPICLKPGVQMSWESGDSDRFLVSCARCGEYQMSRLVADTADLQNYGPRHLLSGAVRNRFEQGEKVYLTLPVLENLRDSVSVPSDPFEAIDLLLRHVLRKTGQRGGVYFEAGFALGLGKPVIWTCRSDDMEKLHFDTRQYNHVTWNTPIELKDKLVNRILATLPRAKN